MWEGWQTHRHDCIVKDKASVTGEGGVRRELKAAGDDDHEGKGFVCAPSEAMYEKVGAVRSMW